MGEALLDYWTVLKREQRRPRDPLTNSTLSSNPRIYWNFDKQKEVKRFLSGNPGYVPDDWLDNLLPTPLGPVDARTACTTSGGKRKEEEERAELWQSVARLRSAMSLEPQRSVDQRHRPAVPDSDVVPSVFAALAPAPPHQFQRHTPTPSRTASPPAM